MNEYSHLNYQVISLFHWANVKQKLILFTVVILTCVIPGFRCEFISAYGFCKCINFINALITNNLETDLRRVARDSNAVSERDRHHAFTAQLRRPFAGWNTVPPCNTSDRPSLTQDVSINTGQVRTQIFNDSLLSFWTPWNAGSRMLLVSVNRYRHLDGSRFDRRVPPSRYLVTSETSGRPIDNSPAVRAQCRRLASSPALILSKATAQSGLRASMTFLGRQLAQQPQRCAWFCSHETVVSLQATTMQLLTRTLSFTRFFQENSDNLQFWTI